MQQIKLFYSPLYNNYFTDEHGLVCEICQKTIEKIMVHSYEWHRRNIQESFYCVNCFNSRGIFGVVAETRVVLIVDVLPEDACPVLLRPPVLKESGLSVFEAVSQKVAPADEIIDNTKYAGRAEGSWAGFQIGAPDMNILAAKDRPLSKEQRRKLLENLKGGK